MSSLNEKIQSLKTKYDAAKALVASESKALSEAEKTSKAAREGLLFFQENAKLAQEKAHTQIAAIVTRCLEAIFDDPYEFKLSFVRKRSRTDAVLSFVRRGLELDPLDSSGGGVVDVAAFALRLARIVLSRPPGRRIMILDEPFKFVSAEHHDRLRELIETLAAELKVQFIIVTHIKALETGTVVRL